MRLGIDFGTTRTAVAVADRGNYPVVSFQTESGDTQAWYPSLIAVRDDERVFGLDAQARQDEPGWIILRSLKRRLADAGPDSLIPLGERPIPALRLLTQYLTRLRLDLSERSNLEPVANELLEAWIAVPANANSNQRFLTLEAFQRAGFKVLGLMNEPSAAGIEYAHRYASKSGSGRREHLVVYDLGGGTFDTAVISMKDRAHEVLINEGIARLGGDDFDEQLLELALTRAGAIDALTDGARYRLLEECREQKEGLHPNTRKIAIDLGRAIEGASEIVVETSEFYRRCAPLVDRTVEAVKTAVARCAEESQVGWDDVAGVYLVGGASDLPIVGRVLREHYGRRVRRSPYPYAATAIGLAIAADTDSGFRLQERFTRYFGVWREAEAGRRVIFDPIFAKGAPLPGMTEPPLVHTRAYHPAHTVGHYRYLECSQLLSDGQPSGDLTPWDEILFPLDPALQEESRLDRLISRRANGVQQQVIEEQYRCDERGIIEVTISNQTAGYQRTYRLRR